MSKIGALKIALAGKRKAAAKLSRPAYVSLSVVKQRSMRMAVSASAPDQNSEPASFGFVPRGVAIEVLSWPKL